MKRTLSLDLDPLRVEASAVIDAWFARQLPLRWPLAPLHAAKARAATVRPDHPFHALAGEAAIRNMSVAALCDLVRGNAKAADVDLMAFEAQRIDAKRELAAADTGQQVEAIVARFGGGG